MVAALCAPSTLYTDVICADESPTQVRRKDETVDLSQTNHTPTTTMKANIVYTLQLTGCILLGVTLAFVAMAPRIWAARESLKEIRAKKEIFDQIKKEDEKFRKELSELFRSDKVK